MNFYIFIFSSLVMLLVFKYVYLALFLFNFLHDFLKRFQLTITMLLFSRLSKKKGETRNRKIIT